MDNTEDQIVETAAKGLRITKWLFIAASTLLGVFKAMNIIGDTAGLISGATATDAREALDRFHGNWVIGIGLILLAIELIKHRRGIIHFLRSCGDKGGLLLSRMRSHRYFPPTVIGIGSLVVLALTAYGTYRVPLVAVLTALLSEPMLAASTQLLGESDFADGAIVSTDSEWLSAQSNESSPATGLYVETITYFHDVDPGPSAILTFSLWDLDSALLGNQVTEFTLDNVPQPITAFETGAPDGSVEFFEFPVDGSAIADGMVQIAFALSTNTHTAGIDFSRLEVVPEPAGLALLIVPALVGQRWMRRRLSPPA